MNGPEAADRIGRRPLPVGRFDPACSLLGRQDGRMDRMGSFLGLLEAALKPLRAELASILRGP